MLKNERLIHRLTLEQRSSLILSNVAYRTSVVEGYEFPVFYLTDNPFEENKSLKCTNYPDYKALSMSWNDILTEKVAELRGLENTLFTDQPFFKLNGKLDRNYISDDPYLTGCFLRSYFKGLSKSTSKTCLEYSYSNEDSMIENEISKLAYEKTVTEGNVDYIIVSTVAEMMDLRTEKKYSGLFLAKPKTREEIVKFINNGVYQIFYEGNMEDAVEYLVHAADVYQNVYGKYKNNVVSYNYYNDLLVEGKALSTEKLETACDDYISFILRQDKVKRQAELEGSYIKNDNELPYKYEEYNKVAYEAAKQSIVLLKNNEGILPLSPKKKVAIIGDCFKNKDYYDELFDHRSSVFKTPFDVVREYLELDYVGYAHGYLKDHSIYEQMISSTRELLKDANVALLYLWAKPGEKQLPPEQLDVLDAIYNEKTMPIVAVVHAPTLIDLSFEDKCSAIIYVPNVGQNMPKAVLDIITGREIPSGKLSTDYPVLEADEYIMDKFPSYTDDDAPRRYSFGFGLSYTAFEYSHLEINSEGVTFTISNIGRFNSYEVPQLYVRKKDSKRSLSKMLLRGYTKVFINASETVKVSIPFDEKTFAYFNEKRNAYGIEGGTYEIFVGSCAESIRLKGTLNLNPFLDKRFAYETSDELTPETFHKFENKEDQAKAVLAGTKLFVSTILFLYLVGIDAFVYFKWCFQSFSVPIDTLFYISTAICLGIFIVVLFFYIRFNVKNFKKRNALMKEYMSSDMTLTNLLSNIDEFEQNDKVQYEVTPVEEPEEEIVEEAPAEEVIQESQEEETEEVQEALEDEEKPIEYQEIDLALETDEEEIEEIVDIESTALSDEEIRAHELEEIRIMEEQNQDKEIADDFEVYDENVTFDNSTSISQTIERFIAYAENRGILFELSSVRSLFSSLASSKIIIITSKVKELVPEAVTILNEFLGNKSSICEAGDLWTSPFYLSWVKDENGQYQKTQFINDIYNACRFKDNINLAILSNVNMDNLETYFSDFIDYANNPTKPHTLRINQKTSIKIPENLTIILLPRDDDYMDHLSKDLAKCASCVELIIRKNENVPEEFDKPDSLSYSYLNELVHEAKKTWYLEEDSWKKIDELEASLSSKEPFVINNKLVIAIENYTSIFIDCGGDEQDALDSVLSERICPIIKTLRVYKEENGIKNLTEMIEKYFGEENVQKTKRVLQSSLKQE